VRLKDAASIERYDSLYVAAHAHDVPLSCAGRLLAEAGRGLRILLVTLFDPGDGPRAADALPVDHLPLGFPDAPRRDAAYCSFRTVTFGPTRMEDESVPRLAAPLEELGHRTHARHVYVPLGVGGHVDHRLAHDAALRAFSGGTERDVFLYEDRPYALLPGAVRVRLGQIGASLPPAATAAQPAGPLSVVLRFQRAPHVRAHLRGLGERVRCTGLALGEWWEARGWRSAKALGPRLQPVLHETDARADIAAAAVACRVGLAAFCGGEVLGRLAEDYSRRFKEHGHVERYWLLLPHRGDVMAADVAASR
jgi:LmbE family N-acetylglucosaminyl deacetylase